MPAEFILGLSGMNRRFAVGLARNSEIVFGVEEDKLRRFRGLGFQHLEGIGSRALDLAFEQVPRGIRGIGQVTYVPPIDASPDACDRDITGITRFLERQYGASPPIVAMDHVESHLAFERAVHFGARQVFMVGRSRAVYSARPSADPRDRYLLDVPSELVGTFEQIAGFLGFPPERVHHLENMARFGQPRFAEGMEALLEAGILGQEETETRLRDLTGLSRRLSGDPIAQAHYDFASSLYRVLESGVVHLLQSVPEAERQGDIVVCGGVFQSWTLNDALARAFPRNRILTSFAPGNASCAIGGPLALRADKSAQRRLGPFLGPEYTREEVKSVLDNSKVRYALHSPAETLGRVSEALAEGKMVGWFRGRCEFGYRALGSRSVFANPANPYACDNLSSYLKKRPAYFAYAVAMGADDSRIQGIESPYLSRSAILDEYFGDARVRVHTVTRADVPGLWQLLETFRARTGVSALLNTSLNYFDEPIACTPRDALKTFYASGLDMLVMEDFLLTKE